MAFDVLGKSDCTVWKFAQITRGCFCRILFYRKSAQSFTARTGK